MKSLLDPGAEGPRHCKSGAEVPRGEPVFERLSPQFGMLRGECCPGLFGRLEVRGDS